MSQELAVQNNVDWNNDSQLKTIKEIYAKNLTNEEFSTFINLGKATGLNPFLRELWCVKYGNSAASIFIGRDGYRKSAQSNRNYDYHLADAVYSNDTFKMVNGEVEHEYKITDRGTLVGGYCIAKRKSSSKPMFVYVDIKEYDTKKALWETKKATMIKKVAEAQCLRMTFQELFAGTYAEEEMHQVETINVEDKIGSLLEVSKQREPETIQAVPVKSTDSQFILHRDGVLARLNMRGIETDKILRFYNRVAVIDLTRDDLEEMIEIGKMLREDKITAELAFSGGE